jgi:hypothetical protein
MEAKGAVVPSGTGKLDLTVFTKSNLLYIVDAISVLYHLQA